MLEEIGEAPVSTDTWARWRRSATVAAEGRMRFAIAVGIVAWLIAAAVGLVLVDGAHRHIVLVYSPLIGLVSGPIALRGYVRRRFSDAALEIRALLVPRLLDAAPDAMVLHLVRFGGAASAAEMKILHVREDGTGVTIEVKLETQPGPGLSSWSSPSG